MRWNRLPPVRIPQLRLPAAAPQEFDGWLHRTLVEGGAPWAQRRAALVAWASAPQARYAHPREEHLLPLMVAFGASGGDPARAVFADALLGAQVSSIQFG
jgi:aromatic ring-opening dioxygenase catalytic subunit (LigB family)